LIARYVVFTINKSEEEHKKSSAIDKTLEEESQGNKEVKLLLLGAGESGKSTIVKQMKQIYLGGFTPTELEASRELVYENILVAITSLVQACLRLSVPLDPQNCAAAEALLNETNQSTVLSGSYKQNTTLPPLVEQLWGDPGVQAVIARSAEFQLIDSATYFLSNLSRIHAANYLPTFEDVLRLRSRTTGIVETEFDAGGLHFRMVDVGGQRNERKKWIHCFDNVTAVMFIVGSSEYDQMLFEDHTVNRIAESLVLFQNVTSQKFFDHASIILFMNKQDLFEEKIPKVPLSNNFPDYKGTTLTAAKTFLVGEFVRQIPPEKPRAVYTHWTCATDTNNVQVVFDAARNTIVTSNLTKLGFL